MDVHTGENVFLVNVAEGDMVLMFDDLKTLWHNLCIHGPLTHHLMHLFWSSIQ